MKSSRSRSRSKSNRNRNGNNNSGGNVVNRVFDSSGPEGKVRGTPQQIIEKYNQLARDAQLAGDRVATENFQQHAEHYTRLLSEAQREIDARREEQERQNRERQAERDRERAERQDREGGSQPTQGGHQGGHPGAQSSDAQPASTTPASVVDIAPGSGDQPDIIEPMGEDGLVDTPESQPKPKPKAPRTRRKPRVQEATAPEATTADDAPAATPDAPEAAE